MYWKNFFRSLAAFAFFLFTALHVDKVSGRAGVDTRRGCVHNLVPAVLPLDPPPRPPNILLFTPLSPTPSPQVMVIFHGVVLGVLVWNKVSPKAPLFWPPPAAENTVAAPIKEKKFPFLIEQVPKQGEP